MRRRATEHYRTTAPNAPSKNCNEIERFGCGRRLLHVYGNPVLASCARVHLGHGGLIAVTVGGNIMRATLAVAVGFCLAFPLSAGAASGACTPGAQATCAQAVNSDFSAARRHRIVSICPPGPPLTRDVCLCEIHGGWPQTYRPIFCFGKPCPGVVVCWPGENRQ
jgi:hypothetical protein